MQNLVSENNLHAIRAHDAAPLIRATSLIIWTVAGVATLALAGVAIHHAGVALRLPDACWQLTGARAAASTAVLGTLVSLRRGQLALFGVLYGGWLLMTHANALLVGSAAAAGAAAWLVRVALTDRGLVARVLTTTLTFNLLLTTSGLIKTISSDAGSRTTLASWSVGLALRTLATLIVAGAFALFSMRHKRSPSGVEVRS